MAKKITGVTTIYISIDKSIEFGIKKPILKIIEIHIFFKDIPSVSERI